MMSIRVSIISMVGISIVVWVTIVSIGSISSGLGISRPLAIEVSIVVGIWVSIVTMVGIAKMVSVSIVTIENTSISTCFSFTGSSGEHAQGNNSLKRKHFFISQNHLFLRNSFFDFTYNGFHHFVFAS